MTGDRTLSKGNFTVDFWGESVTDWEAVGNRILDMDKKIFPSGRIKNNRIVSHLVVVAKKIVHELIWNSPKDTHQKSTQ